jgi:hypothetical protein
LRSRPREISSDFAVAALEGEQSCWRASALLESMAAPGSSFPDLIDLAMPAATW